MSGESPISWLGALHGMAASVGIVSSLVGLAESSVVDGLNVLGIAGIATLIVGGGFYATRGADRAERVRGTVLVSSIAAVVAVVLFLLGDGLDPGEHGFGPLAASGVATAACGVLVLVLATRGHRAEKVPETKLCPECANRVLAAARKCRYCEHFFSLLF